MWSMWKFKWSASWWFQIFVYFHPYLGKIPILASIFQRGWNHQLVSASSSFIVPCSCLSGLFVAHHWFRFQRRSVKVDRSSIPFSTARKTGIPCWLSIYKTSSHPIFCLCPMCDDWMNLLKKWMKLFNLVSSCHLPSILIGFYWISGGFLKFTTS